MVEVWGFNAVSFVSGIVGSFGSWKFLFASFLSIPTSFRGGREARECSRERILVVFCTVMLGRRLVVESIPLASAEEKESVKRRWLEEKRELFGSSV